jgi:hypothetical protein
MKLLHPTFYFAQAYGCGTYGQSAYNQCATDTQGGQNPQGTSGSTQGSGQTSTSVQGDQSTPTDQSQLQQTATPEQSKDFLGPSQTSQPSGPVEETGPMAGIGFDVILFIAFIVALLIALAIYLFRRLKRRNDTDSFNDTTTFPPAGS